MSCARFGSCVILRGLLVVMMSLFALAHVAVAQEAGGSITGQVKDESGGVLPGVTVTATSPALQVPSVVGVTNDQGEYRLSPLPIGLYTVTYELSGFRTSRQEGVRLTVGFIARVDVQLNVGALAETITVSGASPVVDTTSTSVSTQFTRETLELLPGSRNGVIGVMAQAPGVRGTFDIGGSSLNDHPASRTFGQPSEAWVTLEGHSVTDMKSDGGAGVYFDYATVDEARVQTLGADAQFPSRGVQLQMIVKSGGNAFHGVYNTTYTSQRFQANNVDAALAAVGLGGGNPLKNRTDYSGDLSGKLVENKLWFYTAGRLRGYQQQKLGAFNADGSPAHTIQETFYLTEKLSYQMTPANRFVGFFAYTHKHDDAGATQFVAEETRSDQSTLIPTSKFEWEGVRGSLVANLQHGSWGTDNTQQDHSPIGKVGTLDLVTQIATGMGQNKYQSSRNHRFAQNGGITWYKSDWLHGNHTVKTGFENSYYKTTRSQLPRPTNYQMVYRAGLPEEIRVQSAPTYDLQAVNTLSLFLQDAWTIGRRVTLNLGARFAHDNGFVPASCRDAAAFPGQLFAPAKCFDKIQMVTYNSVAPRLRASWDLTGDGKTVLKGGWGRYDKQRLADPEVIRLDPNRINVGSYRWRDLNGNRIWEAGETNLDPNGPDFLTSSLDANAIPNPNEKQPKSDEFSLTFERELVSNLAIRVSGIYSRYRNLNRLQNNLRPYSAYNIPITRPDPGDDGRAGTADDPGVNITYYEYDPALTGLRFIQNMIVNDPNVSQNYKSIDLAAFKRFSSGWQFSASYSATKKHAPFLRSLTAGGYDPIYLAADFTPNGEINTTDNGVEWGTKINAAYIFRYGILVSGNFESRSGDPYARQFQFSGGRTIPNIVLNTEPLGTRQLPAIHLMDARVEKTFNLLNGKKLAARLNIYNLLNKNTVTGLNMRAGTTFERPTAIMAPRILELGATFSF